MFSPNMPSDDPGHTLDRRDENAIDLVHLDPVIEYVDDDSGVLRHFHQQSVNPALDSDDFLLDHVPSNQLQPTSISIENSSDVIIGNVVHYNGPITLVSQNGGGEGEDLRYDTGANRTEHMDVKSDSTDVIVERQTISPAGRRNVKVTGIAFLVVLVVVVLVVVVTWLAVATRFQSTSTGPTRDRFVSRQEWGAASSSLSLTKELQHPTPYAVIGSPSPSPSRCKSFDDCCERMQTIQAFNITGTGSLDLDCNFYIGGSEGRIFEGLGWDVESKYGNDTVSACLIGHYKKVVLESELMAAFYYLLDWGVMKGKLDQSDSSFELIDFLDPPS